MFWIHIDEVDGEGLAEALERPHVSLLSLAFWAENEFVGVYLDFRDLSFCQLLLLPDIAIFGKEKSKQDLECVLVVTTHPYQLEEVEEANFQ